MHYIFDPRRAEIIINIITIVLYIVSFNKLTKRLPCNLFKNVSFNLVAFDVAIESNVRFDWLFKQLRQRHARPDQ